MLYIFCYGLPKWLSHKYSLKGRMLKLKLQSFGHLMQRTRKGPDAGKDWRREEKEMTENEMVEWHHWRSPWVWANSESWWWTWKPGVLQFTWLQRVVYDWVTDLTELNDKIYSCKIYTWIFITTLFKGEKLELIQISINWWIDKYSVVYIHIVIVIQQQNVLKLCGQSIGVSASTSVLPVNIQDWFPVGWIGLPKGFSILFSS